MAGLMSLFRVFILWMQMARRVKQEEIGSMA